MTYNSAINACDCSALLSFCSNFTWHPDAQNTQNSPRCRRFQFWPWPSLAPAGEKASEWTLALHLFTSLESSFLDPTVVSFGTCAKVPFAWYVEWKEASFSQQKICISQDIFKSVKTNARSTSWILAAAVGQALEQGGRWMEASRKVVLWHPRWYLNDLLKT